jgi:hypothetical protein
MRSPCEEGGQTPEHPVLDTQNHVREVRWPKDNNTLLPPSTFFILVSVVQGGRISRSGVHLGALEIS